ncbi:MAG: hypothetical protein IPM54_19715 [Polyangiaceae bacterium]|nr:hypothetical protein [Polyangiaceae bacterium]
MGINQPTCPQNATRLLQDQDWNDAKDGAEKIGKQVGRIFATCEKLMEAVTRPSDLELQGLYDENPGALEKVFNMCAKELDAIPVMPAYDDPWLAGAALRGFEAGVRRWRG